MDHDVELIRDLLFVLETYQTSPRSVIIVSAEAEAQVLGRTTAEIEAGLVTLLDYDYIDGPGPDEPGFFLFRKLTRKGKQFVEATSSPDDWERLKRHFAQKRIDFGVDPI